MGGSVYGFIFFVFLPYVASQCDPGWRSYDGKCWFISNTAALTELTWQEARDYCLQRGGELASVTSQQDQDYLVELAVGNGYDDHLWIGLNQLNDRNSNHTWSDGSTATYRAWAPGQPNADGTEKCIYTKPRPHKSCYEKLVNISTVDGLMDDPRDSPEGCVRHYVSSAKLADCEALCDESSACEVYTFFSSAASSTWSRSCMLCRTSLVGENRVLNQYATSGVKEQCADPVTEYWYSTNCGYEKGFVCTKTPGSDQPVTVPPTPQVPGYCPGGFFGVGNKCFKLYPMIEGVFWDEARERCQQEPGIEPDIASITSLEEQSVITAALMNHSYPMWIGYREYNYEGIWLWADNSDSHGFTNWNANPGYNGDCAEVRTHPGPIGSWFIQSSKYDKRGYICQTFKDQSNVVSTTVGTSNNCPSGFVSYWYGCYKLQTVVRSFDTAQTECSSLNSHLVSIHDESENAAVFALAEGNLPLWIGLQKDDNEYKWLDGWPDIYTNWGAGEPGNGGGCVALETDGTWKDTTCSDQYAFMCKYTEENVATLPTHIEGVCPGDEWEEYGGHCYYFSSEISPWHIASETCRAKGAGFNGHLLSVHSRAVNQWIAKQLGDDFYHDGYWIGLKRANPESPWQWSDYTAVNYVNWAPGEPNGGIADSCVEMYTWSWPGLWNDYTCNNNRPFICMAEKGPLPSTPTLPPLFPGDCPTDEWFPYGEHCFLFRPDAEESWSGAYYGCLKEHDEARLASIRSVDENGFVQQKLRKISEVSEFRSAWIGLIQSNEDDNSKYHWQDGTFLDYTNWAEGEPNNPDERCVEMYSSHGQWNDMDCEVRAGYVCIYNKGGSSTPTPTPPEEEVDDGSGGLSGGAITGIVFGVLIGVAALAVLGYFGFVFYQRRAVPPSSGLSNPAYA